MDNRLLLSSLCLWLFVLISCGSSQPRPAHQEPEGGVAPPPSETEPAETEPQAASDPAETEPQAADPHGGQPAESHPALGLTEVIEFASQGTVDLSPFPDGRIVAGDGATLIGTVQPDWTVVSPSGAILARLEPGGAVVVAPGSSPVAEVTGDGTINFTGAPPVHMDDSGVLSGPALPGSGSPPTVTGVHAQSRRAALYAFIVASFVRARISHATVNARVLAGAVELYQMQNARCPPSLQALVDGGTVSRQQSLTDPWGQRFEFRCTADGPVVFSVGPDGQSGTADDVVP